MRSGSVIVAPCHKNGNASGFIGQYAHGNEPSHQITYMYDFVGQPWKTQALVAKVLKYLYTDHPSGYCGNPDLEIRDSVARSL